MKHTITWGGAFKIAAAFGTGLVIAWQVDAAIAAIVWARHMDVPF